MASNYAVLLANINIYSMTAKGNTVKKKFYLYIGEQFGIYKLCLFCMKTRIFNDGNKRAF